MKGSLFRAARSNFMLLVALALDSTVSACGVVQAGAVAANAPTFGIRATQDTTAITLALAKPLGLAAVANSWHAADVFEYDLDLQQFDVSSGLFRALPIPRTLVLSQKPTATMLASFGGLMEGAKYRVTVTAKGNVGGSAATQILNSAHPATATFDLALPLPITHQTLTVALDSTAFSLTLELPSNATLPGSVPVWATSLDATLADPASTGPAIASATYLPGQAMHFDNVRGDRHYAVSIDIHSPTGKTTTRIPDLFVPRVDGTQQAITPAFPTFVPPTGTVLATYALAGGTFGIAIDAQNHLWVTNQTGNTVSEIDATGTPLVTPAISVGSKPRGIAVDQISGDVWVAEASPFGSIDKIVAGVVATSVAPGIFPAGVAIDPQHRVWVTDAVGSNVSVSDASGTEIPGSPFSVGNRPAAIAIDPVSGDAWIGNSNDDTLSLVTSLGVVSGPYATGHLPGGIAIAPDHTIWVACNGDGTVRRYKPDGSVAAPPLALGNGPSAMAIDPITGAAWVTLLNGNQIAKIDSDGLVLGTFSTGTFPASVAIDGLRNIWIAGGGKVVELAP
jgi:YVTN family beta-propeller protein